MYLAWEPDLVTLVAFGIAAVLGMLVGILMVEMLARRQRRRDREGTMDRLRLLYRVIRNERDAATSNAIFADGRSASLAESYGEMLQQVESVMEWLRYREQRDRTGARLADVELVDLPFR